MPPIVPRLKQLLRIVLPCLAVAVAVGQTKSPKTDAQVVQALIDQSIANYKGSCACPYSKDRAGRNCGGRSAYSKPGGASPLCYAKDVTPKMIEDFRKKTR